MEDKHLHIVSFNVPYPPDYGGVIDVYHKIRWLNRMNIKVHLHCFEYGRERSMELEKMCQEVIYYRRKTGFLSALSSVPYVVKSRDSGALLENLLKDDHPILFEALHTCYLLGHPDIKNRFRIFRESNIEHEYYRYLAEAEPRWLKKVYYLSESWKLRRFEKIVNEAQLILPVSKTDTAYFREHYPAARTEFLPSFHPSDSMDILQGRGEYMLYHGNLEVAENVLAAEYLIENVFNDIHIPFIIAGRNPSSRLRKKILGRPSVSLVENPSETQLDELIKNAHANILITFQPTGIKLKLLNALYKGRFCIVNSNMLEGTGLDKACIVADSAGDMKSCVKRISDTGFSEKERAIREDLLLPYDNQKKAERLLELISF